MTSLVLPFSITYISPIAFKECLNIKDIYYSASQPTKIDDCFDNEIYRNATLWVRESAINICKNVSPWLNFRDIRAYDFGPIEDEVTDIQFDSNSLNLNIGESYKLEAIIYPIINIERTINWESSDPAIATVDDNGVIHAISEGVVTITASCGHCSVSCEVSVTSMVMEVIEITPDEEVTNICIYDLNGQNLGCRFEDLVPGIYIIRQGNSVKKAVVR